MDHSEMFGIILSCVLTCSSIDSAIQLQNNLVFPFEGRLWPHQLDVEGFFVACFRKREAANPYHDGQSWAPAKLLSTSEVMELKHLALEMWDFWPFDEDHDMGQVDEIGDEWNRRFEV